MGWLSPSYRNLPQAAQLHYCHTAAPLPPTNDVLAPSPGCTAPNYGSLWQTAPSKLHLFLFCPGDALLQQIRDRDEENTTSTHFLVSPAKVMGEVASDGLGLCMATQ